MRWCISALWCVSLWLIFWHPHHRSYVIKCNSEEFSHCFAAGEKWKKQFGTLLEHSNHFAHNYSVYMQRISAMFTIKSFREARQSESKVIAIRCTWCWSICCDHLSLFARRRKRLQWRKKIVPTIFVLNSMVMECVCAAPQWAEDRRTSLKFLELLRSPMTNDSSASRSEDAFHLCYVVMFIHCIQIFNSFSSSSYFRSPSEDAWSTMRWDRIITHTKRCYNNNDNK